MAKLKEKKQQKRTAILAAAQQVFLSEGFTGAGMDRIAAVAEVTKQTVYRYFPSKEELFRETLRHMGRDSHGGFQSSLDKADTAEALTGFAEGFIRAHLARHHLDTMRLLIAESAQAPEITEIFFSEGPEDTGAALEEFFRSRLGVAQPETAIRLWTAMLLAFQSDALLGRGSPKEAEIKAHAAASVEFLLAGLAKG
jgi:AcrR family transcriptional regulator